MSSAVAAVVSVDHTMACVSGIAHDCHSFSEAYYHRPFLYAQVMNVKLAMTAMAGKVLVDQGARAVTIADMQFEYTPTHDFRIAPSERRTKLCGALPCLAFLVHYLSPYRKCRLIGLDAVRQIAGVVVGRAVGVPPARRRRGEAEVSARHGVQRRVGGRRLEQQHLWRVRSMQSAAIMAAISL